MGESRQHGDCPTGGTCFIGFRHPLTGMYFAQFILQLGDQLRRLGASLRAQHYVVMIQKHVECSGMIRLRLIPSQLLMTTGFMGRLFGVIWLSLLGNASLMPNLRLPNRWMVVSCFWI